MYCFDCGSLICSHCLVKDHKGHESEFNKEAAPDIKKKLMEKLKPLKKNKGQPVPCCGGGTDHQV